MKNKKEQLEIELELKSLGIDINSVDDELLNLIYSFIGDVYCNAKSSDTIVNSEVLNNYTNKLIKEGSNNVDKKDT